MLQVLLISCNTTCKAEGGHTEKKPQIPGGPQLDGGECHDEGCKEVCNCIRLYKYSLLSHQKEVFGMWSGWTVCGPRDAVEQVVWLVHAVEVWQQGGIEGAIIHTEALIREGLCGWRWYNDAGFLHSLALLVNDGNILGKFGAAPRNDGVIMGEWDAGHAGQIIGESAVVTVQQFNKALLLVQCKARMVAELYACDWFLGETRAWRKSGGGSIRQGLRVAEREVDGGPMGHRGTDRHRAELVWVSGVGMVP
eukprot:1147913-Pelagomonas_calceolata.AAC.8